MAESATGRRRSSIPFDASQIDASHDGVIAVVVWTQGGGFAYAVLLPVQQDKNDPIRLDRSFVPLPNRQGEIYNYGPRGHALQVKAQIGSDQRIFTTMSGVPDTFHVADGNLLCRYLVGEADAEALKTAAEACVVSRLVKEELEAVRKVLEEELAQFLPEGPDLATDVSQALQKLNESWQFTVNAVRKEQEEARRRENQLRKELQQESPWKKVALDLLNALGTWSAVWRSRAVCEAMAAVKKLVDAAEQGSQGGQ